MQYTVCQIGSRQYLIEPGKTFEVDLMDVEKTLKVDKVLLKVDGDKVEIGTPYLKETLELEVVGNIKKDKIRVAKFHAKANYRKVIGSRRQMTVLRLVDTKAKTEKKEVLAPETEESSEKETSKTVVKKGAKKA
jgi:large subunit ribosomal protein L21